MTLSLRLFSCLFVWVLTLDPIHAQQTLRFIENKGQWPSAVTHRAEMAGAYFYCERGSLVIDRYDSEALAAQHANVKAEPSKSIKQHAVRLRFLGADTMAIPRSERPLTGRTNYFLGNDPTRWVSNARPFAAVTMERVAPGCDVQFYEGRSGLKYDLIIQPGSDPSAIGFTYEGASGIELRNGSLIISTSLGRLVERIPMAYQDINGERRTIMCTYTLNDGIVGVVPEKYDNEHTLIIDPELSFATYSGSFSNNFGYTASFDAAGFLYAGSTAFGAQYPITMGAYQTNWHGGATDIAVTKYDTTGTFLIWSTYIGGSAAEMPHSLIVDQNDQLVLLGTSASADYPTSQGAFDNSFGGGTAFTPAGLGLTYPTGCDMVVTKLNSTGSAILGSTFLGGSNNDGLNSAAALKFNYADEVRGEVLLNSVNDVWIVSCTESSDMPMTTEAAQPGFAGGSHDGYVARLSPNLDQLLYASYIGGSGAEAAYNGTVDTQDRLYVCGGTTSTDLNASSTALNGTYNGGTADAFIARFTASGDAIDRLTYWGSPAYDQAYFLDQDGAGSIYLFGQTSAASGALSFNAAYNVLGGGQFVTKMDPDLSALQFCSRIGAGDGTPDISPTAFLVDVCDKIYTSGWGSNNGGLGGGLTTAGLPVTTDAHQGTSDGHDLYLAVFDINMAGLTYATYYGGSLSPEHVDGGTSRFDRRGRVYQSVCAGCQGNSDFPTTPGAWSATNNSGGCNNGVLKFDFDAPLVIASFLAPDTICGPFVTALTNLSNGSSYLWDFGDLSTSTLPSPTHTYASTGTYTITLTAYDPNACNVQDMVQRTITIADAIPTLQALNDTVICGPVASIDLLANSYGTASRFIWSSDPDLTNMLNANTSDSSATISPANQGTYYIQASSSNSCVVLDSISVSIPNARIALFGDSLLCASDTAQLQVSGAASNASFSWEPFSDIISGQGTANVNVAPSDNTVYGVQVFTPSGCNWSGTIGVNVSPINGNSVSATASETTVLAGATVQLFATPDNGVNYSWSPSTGLSDPFIASPTALVNVTTTYTVTVSDGICTRSASVTIKVLELVCDEPDIFVPNTFTPNGDGNNDTLYVRGIPIDRLEFMVFDRWGEKVFETTDKNIGWDGMFNGKPADPAVFVYHLTAFCKDGQRYFTKGNVSVVR
ncbi:MAG: gliding motility-associated C-terminal domain-containing protein [Flavobacteriales bacterium]|nr:gliding motility-associated C-terminal domain-containing protein [Flavobacteriales bacterium]